ncbi:hypothetical protein [Nonomuraea dietziae]|uniref:hypothetical protein n=1 Tax=Nonomuraea dietziae TaxID=65515 RepID=UPI0033C1AC18
MSAEISGSDDHNWLSQIVSGYLAIVFPPRIGRAAATAMPTGSFAEITGHAHGGAIEAGDQITPLVLDFFAAH